MKRLFMLAAVSLVSLAGCTVYDPNGYPAYTPVGVVDSGPVYGPAYGPSYAPDGILVVGGGGYAHGGYHGGYAHGGYAHGGYPHGGGGDGFHGGGFHAGGGHAVAHGGGGGHDGHR